MVKNVPVKLTSAWTVPTLVTKMPFVQILLLVSIVPVLEGGTAMATNVGLLSLVHGLKEIISIIARDISYNLIL